MFWDFKCVRMCMFGFRSMCVCVCYLFSILWVGVFSDFVIIVCNLRVFKYVGMFVFGFELCVYVVHSLWFVHKLAEQSVPM